MELQAFSEAMIFKHVFATTGIGSLRPWFAKITYLRKCQKQSCKGKLSYKTET